SLHDALPILRRAQTGAIDRFEFNIEAVDVQQRELVAQVIWIYTCGHHRAEYHVAARTGKTVEIKSLHFENSGNTSPALPVSTSSQRSDNGVRSGLTSTTYAPAAFAISGMPAAG